MKDNSLIPNGFFLASKDESSSWISGMVLLEGRRGVFPTMEMINQNYDEHPVCVKGFNVVSVFISPCEMVDSNQKFAFKARTATIVDIKALAEIVQGVNCDTAEVAQS